MELPDKATCYKALQSKDTRFDGLIFVGVTSTGIYCRPVCPARTAKFENCAFYGSAAGAQEAGYRPCLRCRPETAPQFASWKGTSNTVSRALALIGDGALDGEHSSVEKLANRLGVGERQLRRLFVQHLGASPVAVAQTRRVLFAKQLIHDTKLPMTEVALAAGFNSLRRFNEVFADLFQRPPGAIRRRAPATAPDAEGRIVFRIRYRPPYDWGAMLESLRARAIAGVDVVEQGVYKRTIEIGEKHGSIEVKQLADEDSLSVTIHFPTVTALQAIVNRVRRMFDLGADIETIDEHLSLDDALRPWVEKRPGLRAPGSWEGSDADAFPAANPRLLRGAERVLGEPLTPKRLEQRAEAWRPWRAYAAQHLWVAGAAASPQDKPPLRLSPSRPALEAALAAGIEGQDGTDAALAAEMIIPAAKARSEKSLLSYPSG